MMADDGRQNIQISIWTSSSSTRMKLLVENPQHCVCACHHIHTVVAVVHAGAMLFTISQLVGSIWFRCLQFYFARILQAMLIMLGKCQRFDMFLVS